MSSRYRVCKRTVSDMAYEKFGSESLDYLPCQYDGCRLTFRGPRRNLSGSYAVFLGGTETYGKFIRSPYPDLCEKLTGYTCVNMGWPNAGMDVLLNEPAILTTCQRAQAVVLQMPCVQNMSNRFYTVHPRRNDRFVKPSKLMKTIFSDVDFTEFHFTRHLLSHLQAFAPDRFAMVRDELQTAWVARMRWLISQLGEKTILLWFSKRDPNEGDNSPDLALDPAFVTRRMVMAAADGAAHIVSVREGPLAKASGTAGMVFSDLEATAAAELLNPIAHEEAALALKPVLEEMMRQP